MSRPNIILCGPPFTGKSTLGKLAAVKLGWQFHDTDQLLEKCYADEKTESLTFREIHRKEGNAVFRYYENRAVISLKDSDKCVIALGGGCLIQQENVLFLQKLGILIYIKTPLTILKKRLLENALPSYLEKEKEPVKAFESLVNARIAIYEKHAHKIIDTTSLNQDEVLSILIKKGHDFEESN